MATTACVHCSRIDCVYPANSSQPLPTDHWDAEQINNLYDENVISSVYDISVILRFCSTFYIDADGQLQGYRWYQLVGRISVWWNRTDESEAAVVQKIVGVFNTILTIREARGMTIREYQEPTVAWRVSPLNIEVSHYLRDNEDVLLERHDVCFVEVADNMLHIYGQNEEIRMRAERVRHERTPHFYRDITTQECFLPPSIQKDGFCTYLSRQKQIYNGEAALLNNYSDDIIGTPWEQTATSLFPSNA